MLPTNFDTLAAEHPQLKRALLEIREWIRTHPDWNVLDPRVLSESLRKVDSFTLAYALHLLVQHGLLRQVYMVVTPSGVLAEGEYDDPKKIPLKVPDRFNNYFETSEADIVPVLIAANDR
ncbi:MAG: hypothetical protein ABSG52_14955 [Terriglobales bacterium]|jgi:hypothetical protein